MRIRISFAVAFCVLTLVAGYAGLSSLQLNGIIDDKVLHTLTFFVLTICFYWILDTSRRRSLNLTLVVCTGILGIGSEFLQWVVPNDRNFDFYDIVANIVGSLGAVALCSWYHNRMLERKRLSKSYQVVATDDHDLELGEGIGVQESGTTPREASASTLEEELDNWDENAEDAWDEDEHTVGTESGEGEDQKTPSASSAGDVEPEAKKRTD